MNFDFKNNQFVPPALLIALGFVLSTMVGAYTFYQVRSFDNVLTVTGSAKERVTADSAKWHINIVRRVTEYDMQSGYPLLARDLAQVQAFLKANKITDDMVTVSQIFVEEQYNYGSNSSGPRQYNLRQEILVQSTDVKSIDVLTKNINELSAKGVFISGNSPEYFVSNLPDLRVSLLADAIKDAKARAEQIAKAGSKKVGALKSASSGVVQVLAPNSIDVSDYGQYDTQSIEKDVMVTARATFLVR